MDLPSARPESESFGRDSLEDDVRFFAELVVREPKDAVAEGLEIKIAVFVVGGLSGCLVNAAVELHDELQLKATEVGDEWRNRELPPELQSVEATASQQAPELALGWRLLPPKISHARPDSLLSSP
jgi:hypothetical protein